MSGGPCVVITWWLSNAAKGTHTGVFEHPGVLARRR